MLVLSLAACGGVDNSDTPSGSEGNTPSSQQTQQPSNTSDNSQPSGGDRADWGYADYAEYTDGVPEPEFAYTISGVIGESFTFKGETSADEINVWKQTLLDNGAEEVREGDTWAVIDGTHLIEMNAITNGVAYFYISLDDRPVSGSEQPEPDSSSAPGGNGESETNSGEVEGIAWPENDITNLVPKPEKATVISADSMGESRYGIVLAMTFDDAYAYAEQLVADGFEGDLEMLNSNSKMFYGTNADGVKVSLMWNTDTQAILNVEVQ